MEVLKYKIISSPVGHLKLIAQEKALIAILWDNEKLNRVKTGLMIEDLGNSLLLETEKQLNEYFQHKRKNFDLPLQFYGTPFQKFVWELLNKIPYGTTVSYKDIAMKMNNPKAVRATGGAIGRNPLSIVVPCHRVVGANGSLTGFAGGIVRKKTLLDLERNI